MQKYGITLHKIELNQKDKYRKMSPFSTIGSAKFSNGPKQRHYSWKCEGLTKWIKWSRDFRHLADEFGYLPYVRMTRLKKYTAKCNEYDMVLAMEKHGLR